MSQHHDIGQRGVLGDTRRVRVLRVVVLNKDQSASGKVFITLSGNYGHGQLKLLSAPSASSMTGVTY